MATSQIASMLDELMGRNRNFAPDDAKARELKWTDNDVCKYYIVQFCPHDLFTNTKADLGTCGKIHDDALKVSNGACCCTKYSYTGRDLVPQSF